MDTTLPKHLVLFDGVCGLCDRTVQFLLEHDEAGLLRFATLQGETAAAIFARHPELEGVDSVVYIEREGGEERVHVRSKAVFKLCGRLDAKVRWLAVFGVLPQALADVGYDAMAKVRYAIFGKLDACRIPTPETRARFLP